MKSTVEMLTGLMSCHATTSNVENVNKAMEVMKGYAEAEGLYATVEDFDGRHAMFVATVPGKEVDFLLNTQQLLPVFFHKQNDGIPDADQIQITSTEANPCKAIGVLIIQIQLFCLIPHL